MKTSITSGVTPGQKNQWVTSVACVATKVARVTIEELEKTGVITKARLQRVMAQGDKMASAVGTIVKTRFVELMDVTGCLKLISDDKELTINATDGTETIAKGLDVFSSISPNFVNWGCDVESEPTEKTNVAVYGLDEDALYQRVFCSFGENPDRLCLTQPQIKGFTKEHRGWFSNEGQGTLFLFKGRAQKVEERYKYFIAIVRLFSVGYFVADIDHFSSKTIRRVSDGYRVVIPKLI